MTLTLDTPLGLTDLSTCGRCGQTTQIEQLFRCADHSWICQDCITEAIETQRLATVAGRKV
ncbi:hypothetical protein F5972_11025 [Microbispora cellulosiformans]|uniref:ClpX-type ZB domain-containing protein n=1 Tax=Microbispora cellulosiformans TaxID=2614688 RepID=A0A5J5K8H2_9ACTN|nr:hypothetical protein [Microbispora cellulosiformans]KAA9380128.1 hypothetical protein F5972_11025 [Microbispora cellulosiformans]